MELVGDNWIGLVGLASITLAVLFTGVRVFNGDYYQQVGPLVRIPSFWLWLTMILAFAACVGVATFFVASARAG